MASMLVTAVRVFILLNLVLLAGLGSVWLRNWWELRSKHALGLVLFAGFLIGENALAAYFFLVDPTLAAWIGNEQLVPPIAQMAMASLRVLEFVGLAFLAWITYD